MYNVTCTVNLGCTPTNALFKRAKIMQSDQIQK